MERENLEIVRTIETKKLPRLTKIGINLIGVSLLLTVFSLRELLQVIQLEWPNSLLIVSVIVPVIILHELSHGVVFKLYTGIMKFGFKLKTGLGPVFYTTCPKCLMPRNRMILAYLAPQVLTLIALAILAAVKLSSIWLANSLLLFAAFNLAGGCADLFMVYIMTKEKGRIFVEDTGTGAIFYRQVE